MNEYAATFGTSKDASAMSRAILPKLTAKWETISNMGPLNKGVSEQIRQTVWINKQQNPDLEITAEMLTRPVTDAAAAPAAPGGARRRRRTADATADGGGGLPAEDSIAAGNVGSPLPLPAAAAAGSCGLAAAESAAAGSAAAAEVGSLSPATAAAAVAGPPAHCSFDGGFGFATDTAAPPPPAAVATAGGGQTISFDGCFGFATDTAGSPPPPPPLPPAVDKPLAVALMAAADLPLTPSASWGGQ